ncbi:protein C1orf194 homolog isoform X2 [Mauremys reevesii]|uniref:protein C1orf194 homolog isoform X2 n=1 Tax=Mauremys reevesii TaxID=260615 RepID=UPI00193F945E|nr:protein C1orf194 homolog isoform X2 [Mauremys reevesii]
MPPTRDPFPYPRYENEDTFRGQARPGQTGPYTEPTHLAQQRDPWNRLHRTPTLSSTRKEVWYTELEVPRDSLDFKLTSLYNHHEEQLRDKSEIVIHKETLLDDHGVSPHSCHQQWILPQGERQLLLSVRGLLACALAVQLWTHFQLE